MWQLYLEKMVIIHSLLFAWKYPILAISLATGERGPDISIPNVNYNPANIYVKIEMNTINDELNS